MSGNSANNEWKGYEDEIDLFDLMKKIWKWKWLIIVLIVVSVSVVFVRESTKPDLYTAKAHIKIGKLAGKDIEEADEVAEYMLDYLGKKYLLKKEFNEENSEEKKQAINKLYGIIPSKGQFTATLIDNQKIILSRKNGITILSATTKNSRKSYEMISGICSSLLAYHEKIFSEGRKQLQKNIILSENENLIHPVYRLSTYNFPSKVLGKLGIPESPDGKKIKIKLAATFLGTMFIGIFLALFLNYFSEEIKKRR